MSASARPLEGLTILVATPEDRAGELAARLREAGARAFELPTVTIAPLEELGPLDEALKGPLPYDWAVFTSPRSPVIVASRCRTRGVRIAGLARRVAAVGPATAREAGAVGLRVDFVPERFLTEAIADGLGDLRGKRVFLPRSEIAPKSLTRKLEGLGAAVREVPVYRSVPSPPRPELELPKADLVVFTSASSAQFLAFVIGPERFGVLRSGTPAACIGPVTAEAARALGFQVRTVARPHTIEGLLATLAREVRRSG